MFTRNAGRSKHRIEIFAAILAMHVAATALASPSTPTANPECKVVVIGASYAKDWPISRIGAFIVTNQGIGGNQSFEMAQRFHTDVVNQKADAVIIWGFINDVFRSPPEHAEATKQRILDSYSQMISAADENAIRPIIATEVSIREPDGFFNSVASIIGRLRGKVSYQSTINYYVSDINADLLAQAAVRNVPVLDFHNVLTDENGIRHAEFATEDGSHISSAGYVALTKYVSENLPTACAPDD